MSKILIIDDDQTVQIVLKKILRDQGYEVEVSSNGSDGLKKAEQFRPALIICDWMMPMMDGLEVCRQLKANPELSSAFFILLTSRAAIEDRVEGLDSGADDFLSKPVELSELKARVRAGLRLHQINRDLQAQKRILESEFLEAAAYVRSLLPPPLTGSLEIDSRFIPSRQLGGDCFDYYWLDPDYLVIYLLDVSGHGLGSALPSISVLNMLRSQSMDGVNFYQPSRVLQALNEAFQMDYQNDKYFTIWYGVYNQNRRQLVYSSAGHPPAVLLTSTDSETNEVKMLKTSSMPVGMLPDSRYVDQRCTVTEGSTLYVFSDGIYEILQDNGSIWGLEAFVNFLQTERQSIQTQGLDLVLERVRALNPGGDALEDDLSVLRVNFI